LKLAPRSPHRILSQIKPAGIVIRYVQWVNFALALLPE